MKCLGDLRKVGIYKVYEQNCYSTWGFSKAYFVKRPEGSNRIRYLARLLRLKKQQGMKFVYINGVGTVYLR